MLKKLLLLTAVFLTTCTPSFNNPGMFYVEGGDPQRGEVALRDYGCGACHTIPGIPGANATVGPSLTNWAERAYIVGSMSNTPENLLRWLQVPQEIEPGSVMPNLDVTEQAARDMSAYLYTLRGD
jgi:cytochrome c1